VKLLSHLLMPRAALGRRFPAATLSAIEAAIAASERQHRAEIRFAIEVALDLRCLKRVRNVRERALEVFGELGVWSTREHNGVLLYVLLAERHVEIVADRGLTGRVSEAEWRDWLVARWGAARPRGRHGAVDARVPRHGAESERAAGPAGAPLGFYINLLGRAHRVKPEICRSSSGLHE
jgi:TPM domain